MRPFYLLLMILWAVLVLYTGRVIADHGLGLFPVFFGDIARGEWPGQFNLDFTMMLFVSASWTAWRNGFSPSGWLLAAVAFVGGAGFLLPYLTYLAWKHRGDTATVLLGVRAKEPAT
jgi:hypothetical protein